jgi:hypothetical protein
MRSAADHCVPEVGADAPLVGLIDKWIYVFMATLFVATTLVGFIPDSLAKITAVATAQRAPFPPVLHVHAVLMGLWLLLLLAQTTLMATGHAAYHKQLGLASLVLAPAILLTGLILVPTMYGQLRDALAAASPGLAQNLKAEMAVRTNIMLMQVRAGILFAAFVVLALRARHSNPGFHKRMIVIATLMPLPAAFDRIEWLPSTFPVSPVSPDLYTLLWILPMFTWDLVRLGRVHSAYVVALAAWLPATIVVQGLWAQPGGKPSGPPCSVLHRGAENFAMGGHVASFFPAR